jgi:hypothetical protein
MSFFGKTVSEFLGRARLRSVKYDQRLSGLLHFAHDASIISLRRDHSRAVDNAKENGFKVFLGNSRTISQQLLTSLET